MLFRSVRRGYLEILRAEPKRVRLVDASRPVDEVARRVRELVADHLGVAERALGGQE